MITVIAVIGWLLFAFTAYLYRFGNRENSAETNALAAYSLALLFSDGFRSGVYGGISSAAKEARLKGMSSQALVFALMQGVTSTAKRHYQPTADAHSVSIVTSVLEKMA